MGGYGRQNIIETHLRLQRESDRVTGYRVGTRGANLETPL